MAVIGEVFGKLTVVSDPYFVEGKLQRYTNVDAKCECGRVISVRLTTLRTSTRQCKFCINKKHGKSTTAEYSVWSHMMKRCYSEAAPKYPIYGGRGIKVCERWHDFELFYKDMAPRPAGLTLDRIDNEKGYSKENCRWATQKQQQRNRRNNRILEFDGRSMTIAEWGDTTGFGQRRINDRLGKGWTVERALTQPIKQRSSALRQPIGAAVVIGC